MAVSEQAPNRLFVLVRDFALQTPAWAEAVRYDTQPDERFDLTLVSQRVYGRRTEFLVVQAAAGLDSPELELSERRLVLPTESQLRVLKQQAGYGSPQFL
jgi:hypothetical protein